jgi:hypothetical protein
MRRVRIAGTAVALSLASAWAAGADPKQTEKPADPVVRETADREEAETKIATRVPIFVPRDVGAPQARLRGASRGPEFAKIPSIDALVPEQLGYTLSAQPVLYWYLSDPTDRRVEFTLDAQDSESENPVLEVTLAGPHEAGINRIDLASYDVTLKPGVTYMWYVTLLPDPESRSDARVSGGAIQLMMAPPELQNELDAADADQHPFILAAAGIWYDALSVLSEGTRSASRGAQRDAQRAALLEQVGLGAVAVP